MLCRNKLSQVAIEFLMMIGLAFFVFFVFIGVSLYYTNNFNKQREIILVDDLALYIQRELKLAETVKDGYYREFKIPDKVNNKDFNLIQQSNEVTIKTNRYESHVSIPILQGNLQNGVNIVNKTGGVIYIN